MSGKEIQFQSIIPIPAFAGITINAFSSSEDYQS